MTELYKTAASLNIFGDDLDPEEITQQLGKIPTVAEKRGEIIKNPSGRERTARRGRWSIKVDRVSPGDLDRQIATILEGTSDDIDTWRRITTPYRAYIFCGLFMQRGNEGIIISADTLKLLGERGIDLDLDIYDGPCSE